METDREQGVRAASESGHGLDPKWAVSLLGSIVVGLYLFSSFVRRAAIAEQFGVPMEAVGDLIGDRGWAGYAMLDASVALGFVVMGWLNPVSRKNGLATTVFFVGLVFASLWGITALRGIWVPPVWILLSLTLGLLFWCAFSLRLLLFGEGSGIFVAAAVVLSAFVAFFTGTTYLYNELLHGRKIEDYIDSRAEVYLHTDEQVEWPSFLDPAADPLRVLGVHDGIMYLYREATPSDPQPGAFYWGQVFGIQASDVMLLSDSPLTNKNGTE